MYHMIPMYSYVNNKRSSLGLKMLHTIGKETAKKKKKETAVTWLVAVFLRLETCY